MLESNGALHQVCHVATRNSSTLELVITDMATMFHPPTVLPPIQQDENTKGKPNDHSVVIVAPRTDVNFKKERHKRKVHIRPLPESKVSDFMREIGLHDWSEVSQCENPNDKAYNYHAYILNVLNKHLTEKTVNMTSLDKTWFTPSLKLKYNEMQREFFKNGKSCKWKKL